LKSPIQDDVNNEKLSKNQLLEEEIRKAKLKDIMRMKEELERKLITLNENAEVLEKAPNSNRSPLHLRKDENYYKLSKEDRKKLKEELKQKEAEAYEFIKKTKKETYEHRRKIQEKLEQERELHRKKMDEEIEENKKREAEVKAAKKEQLAKSFELLKQKHEADIKKRQEQQEKYQAPSVYLYQKIEEQYRNKVLLPLLEDKKAKLAEKRNILKPVTKEELDSHKRAVEEYERKRSEERKKAIEDKKLKDLEMEENLKKFQTKISTQIHERDEKTTEEQLKKSIEKKAIRDKMTSYAKLVKDICPVSANEEKAAELQHLISRLKHPVKQPRDVRKQYELATLRKMNLTSKSADHDKKEEDAKKDKPRKESVHPIKNTENSKGNNIRLPPAVNTERQRSVQEPKKLDYLAELRKKRGERYKASKPGRYNWSVDLNNEKLAPVEKRERVERKAKMIEEEAKMKEKLFHLKGGVEKNIEMGDYVADMFLDAVKAKLALLDQM